MAVDVEAVRAARLSLRPISTIDLIYLIIVACLINRVLAKEKSRLVSVFDNSNTLFA